MSEKLEHFALEKVSDPEIVIALQNPATSGCLLTWCQSQLTRLLGEAAHEKRTKTPAA